MALNAAKVSSNSNKKFETLPAGTYPGYFVQIVDLGMQPRNAFKGEEKAPMQHVALTYELADEFMKDEDGQEIKDKPLWRTETLPLFNLQADRAISTQRYNVLDPSGTAGGDFAALLGTPVNITIVNNPGTGKNVGKVFEKIAGISSMREKDAAKLPGMKNEPRFFDMSAPDLSVFNSLTQYTQEKIKAALDYSGSALEGLLGSSKGTGAKVVAKPAKAVQQAVEDDQEEDDNPY